MIHNKIKYYREIQKINQEEMAVALDITRTYLSKLENNKYPPSPQLMEDICIFFNKSLGEMFYIMRD